MKKLLLLFFFGALAYAQPNINTPMDLIICQIDGDGVGNFDLTTNNMVMLAGQDPSLYNVTYHETQAEANFGQNAISNPTDYVSMTNVVFARVTEIADSNNYAVAQFSVLVLQAPTVPDLPAILQCEGPFDLTTNNNLINPNYTVIFYASLEDAEEGTNPIANPQNYTATAPASVWLTADMGSQGCGITIAEQELLLYADVFEASLLFDAQTVTLTTPTEGDYQYKLDEGPWQDSPTFLNVAYGSHVAQVQNPCENILTLSFTLTPNQPVGETEQSFTEGATLADLEVEGENIQWYQTAEGDTPLNMSTALVDNTTYYATQTIDNVESNARLAVTVNLTAGINENAFTTLKYYPNPASNILNIENATDIDSVSLVNALGQTVLSKTINGNIAQIDISPLSKGIYFVTVVSGTASKTIKIIKE